MCFESTFVHPGNGCFDRLEDVSYVLLMEFLYVDDLVLCRESLMRLWTSMSVEKMLWKERV